MKRNELIIENIFCEAEDCLNRRDNEFVKLEVRGSSLVFTKYDDSDTEGDDSVSVMITGVFNLKRTRYFIGYNKEVTYKSIAEAFPLLKYFKCFKKVKDVAEYGTRYEVEGKFSVGKRVYKFSMDSQNDTFTEEAYTELKERLVDFQKKYLEVSTQEETEFLADRLKKCSQD
jgi:hypothetical protein